MRGSEPGRAAAPTGPGPLACEYHHQIPALEPAASAPSRGRGPGSSTSPCSVNPGISGAIANRVQLLAVCSRIGISRPPVFQASRPIASREEGDVDLAQPVVAVAQHEQRAPGRGSRSAATAARCRKHLHRQRPEGELLTRALQRRRARARAARRGSRPARTRAPRSPPAPGSGSAPVLISRYDGHHDERRPSHQRPAETPQHREGDPGTAVARERSRPAPREPAARACRGPGTGRRESTDRSGRDWWRRPARSRRGSSTVS